MTHHTSAKRAQAWLSLTAREVVEMAILVNPITGESRLYDLRTAAGMLGYMCDLRDGWQRDDEMSVSEVADDDN